MCARFAARSKCERESKEGGREGAEEGCRWRGPVFFFMRLLATPTRQPRQTHTRTPSSRPPPSRPASPHDPPREDRLESARRTSRTRLLSHQALIILTCNRRARAPSSLSPRSTRPGRAALLGRARGLAAPPLSRPKQERRDRSRPTTRASRASPARGGWGWRSGTSASCHRPDPALP